MTQERLDAIWQQFQAGHREPGFVCISNGRLEHITEIATDTTWERKRTSPEWKPVFPITALRQNPPDSVGR